MAERSPQQQSSKKNESPKSKTQGSQEVAIPASMDVDNLTPDNIIHLQRTMGNQFVTNLVQRKQKDGSIKSSASTTPSFPRIQRAGTRSVHDQAHTVDDPGVNDLAGATFDYIGFNQNEGLNITGGDNGTGDLGTGAGTSDTLGTVGSVGSIVTGTIGTGMGVYNLTQNARLHAKANAALKEANRDYKGDGTIPGDTELYATVALLERTRTDAIKGEVESVGNIIGGISGLVNGIAGLINGATAALVSGVAFGVGAGLGAIFSTIAAIRDFVSAGKRAKTQKEIGRVRASYVELYTGLGEKSQALKDQNDVRQGQADDLTQESRDLSQQWSDKAAEVVDANTELDEKRAAYEEEESTTKRQSLIADIMLLKPRIAGLAEERDALEEAAQNKADAAQVILQQIATTAAEILTTESKYDEYGKMITALTTAERKQGFGGKIGTGIINLLGAGGSIALLAATLGAGAAAGPVGWVLSGVALLGIIGYAVGMHIKRKIRESNVKRMKQEIVILADYIANGTLPSGHELPDGYTPSTTESERRDDIWHRSMFPTTEKKGWFNKLISKKRSGTMTMGERVTLITNYLGKYDVGAQAEVIATGFVKSLQPGPDGDQEVTNPAYSDDLSPELKANTPQTVTLRDMNMGLLAHFFGDKADEMKVSLLSADDDKSDAAKELLAKKMKLGG